MQIILEDPKVENESTIDYNDASNYTGHKQTLKIQPIIKSLNLSNLNPLHKTVLAHLIIPLGEKII